MVQHGDIATTETLHEEHTQTRYVMMKHEANEVSHQDLANLNLAVGDKVTLVTRRGSEVVTVKVIWDETCWDRDSEDFQRKFPWQIDFDNGTNIRVGDPRYNLHYIQR